MFLLLVIYYPFSNSCLYQAMSAFQSSIMCQKFRISVCQKKWVCLMEYFVHLFRAFMLELCFWTTPYLKITTYAIITGFLTKLPVILYIYIYTITLAQYEYHIYRQIPLHTHDYLTKIQFETLVWRLMKGLARN